MYGRPNANRHDVLAGALLALALMLLLLPFLSYSGDYETEMKIRFREAGMQAARTLILPESEAVCSEIQFTLADGDGKTGPYTKVAC
jgi:hypothetical protein